MLSARHSATDWRTEEKGHEKSWREGTKTVGRRKAPSTELTEGSEGERIGVSRRVRELCSYDTRDSAVSQD